MFIVASAAAQLVIDLLEVLRAEGNYVTQAMLPFKGSLGSARFIFTRCPKAQSKAHVQRTKTEIGSFSRQHFRHTGSRAPQRQNPAILLR